MKHTNTNARPLPPVLREVDRQPADQDLDQRAAAYHQTTGPVTLPLELDASLVRKGRALAKREGITFDELAERAVKHHLRIELEPDLLATIRREARREGLTLDAYVERCILEKHRALTGSPA